MIGRIVTLSPDDDAAAVRDRVEWAGAERVILVMPDNARGRGRAPLPRELDFMLVKRIGDQLGVEIAVASRSPRQRMLVRQVGLVAFRRAEDAVRQAWIPPDEVQPIQRQTPPRRFQPRSLRRFFARRNWLSIGFRLLLAMATVAVVVAAGLILTPTAQVTLTASSQSLSTIVPVTLNTLATEPDGEGRVVPAQRVDVIVEDSFTTAATGAKDIPKYKASGTATFLNTLAIPYTVPKNTVVRTSSSNVAVRFTTLAPVEVPAGGRADAPIQAIEPGPSGNVPAGQINQVEGMPALAVRVTNAAPTGGGGYETVRSVVEADYRRARSALRSKLMADALDKIRQDPDVLRNGLYVVPDTLFIADVQDETFDRFITEQADDVTLNMRLQMGGLAVSPAHLIDVARQALGAQVPEGFSLLNVSTERGDVAEEGTGPNTEYYIAADGIAGAEIDENAVKKAVRGKTPGEAQSTLLQMLSLRGNPQITISPGWYAQLFNRLPFITLRIETAVRRE